MEIDPIRTASIRYAKEVLKDREPLCDCDNCTESFAKMLAQFTAHALQSMAEMIEAQGGKLN